MASVKFRRYGNYGGELFVFSHRNPMNNEVWSDDIPVIEIVNGKPHKVYGAWVPSDKVRWGRSV